MRHVVFEPAPGGVVVMGAGIGRALGFVVVGGVGVAGQVVAEGEVEQPHPRKPEPAHDLPDVRGDHPQVLGDDGQAGEPGRKAVEEVHRRDVHPPAVHGGLFLRRHLPIGDQPPEMVEPDPVEQGQVPVQPIGPPVETPLPEHVPPVNGVAPQLAGGAEIVGRDPGHGRGTVVFIQLEQLPVRPDVRAVMVDVDGDVAQDLDLPAVGIGLEGGPLPVEDELEKPGFADQIS